jgi:hypothetical protein
MKTSPRTPKVARRLMFTDEYTPEHISSTQHPWAPLVNHIRLPMFERTKKPSSPDLRKQNRHGKRTIERRQQRL